MQEFNFLFFIALGLPKHVEPMLRDTLKDFVILPHRDKFGRRIVLLRVCHAQNSRFLRMSKSLDAKVYKDLG